MGSEIKNIYVDITGEFNEGRLRAVLCSGQAAVLHRIAIMSKDGDWIVREEQEALSHILNVLHRHGAKYRFGAPFDARWLAGGWSSHFEFMHGKIRVRTDFFSRPPRITAEQLNQLWKESEEKKPPFTNKIILAEMKKTNREKDYAVIGELARRMENPEDMLLYSRSAKDILHLASQYPDVLEKAKKQREILQKIPCSVNELEKELDAERRKLMHENEIRLQKYLDASSDWADNWNHIQQLIEGKSLLDAHKIITEKAEKLLPFSP